MLPPVNCSPKFGKKEDMGIEIQKTIFTIEAESKIYKCNRCSASEAFEISEIVRGLQIDVPWRTYSANSPPEWLVVRAMITQTGNVVDAEEQLLAFCPACAPAAMEIIQGMGTT